MELGSFWELGRLPFIESSVKDSLMHDGNDERKYIMWVFRKRVS